MNKLLICLLMIPVALTSLPASSSASDNGVVHAVLFYSPSCGHCHLVITETLPPLFEKYGDQLSIVGVDVTQTGGQALFMAALQYFNLESGGVPFLVVGDTYLIGSLDIPEKFPILIEQYLAQGGVDWPAIPGMAEALAPDQSNEAAPATEALPTSAAATLPASATPGAISATPTPGLLMTNDNSGGVGANFDRDRLGNTLAVIVLVLMILSVGIAISYLRRAPNLKRRKTMPTHRWSGLVPVLCLIGLGVAGYLAYVETARVEAVCGPVGDCNTVQQSEYARLFGVLPIGLLGVVGYIMIFLSWSISRSANQRHAAYASLTVSGMAAFGVFFSIYLTFLEPFVIGATCAWCLSSAIVMTALLWLSLPPARLALSDLLPRGRTATRRSKLGRIS